MKSCYGETVFWVSKTRFYLLNRQTKQTTSILYNANLDMRNNNSKNNFDHKIQNKILPLLNKTCTISKFPMLAAEWSGAHPSSSALFITIADSSIANSTFTTWSPSKSLCSSQKCKDSNFNSVVTPGNFVRVFLNKYKLHNLIKRKFYILITTIKKYANT